MPELRKVSGRAAIKVLVINPEGKVGTVMPIHKEMKIGTLKGILNLAKVDPDEFNKYI